MTDHTNLKYGKLIPVMLCFFAMGFVDLVGIASNYVKADLGLSDSEANIFPSLVFFWFLIFSVPTGVLMNRIGRKRTVLLSLVVTALSLLLPVFGDSYGLMLCSFSLLGIGNALMQTSLNPLLSNIISGDKLASSLTFGQFVKAIASFLAPYIAMWGATQAIPTFGLEWRVLFPVYMVIAVLAMIGLLASDVHYIIYTCIALIGFGNSNVFSIIFSQALLAVPEKKNEVSGLMIMGLFGGTVFPLLMGFAGDAMGQSGAVTVMLIGVLYLIYYTTRIKKQTP